MEQFVERTVNFVSIDQQQMTFPDFLILMSQRRTDQKCNDRERAFDIDNSFVIVIFIKKLKSKCSSFHTQYPRKLFLTSLENDNDKS